MQGKQNYLLKAPMGTIVAFKVNSSKDIYLTGKIIKRNCESKYLIAKTKKGKEYNVDFSNVIWVKTGKRWPKPVFNLLLGGKQK